MRGTRTTAGSLVACEKDSSGGFELKVSEKGMVGLGVSESPAGE